MMRKVLLLVVLSAPASGYFPSQIVSSNDLSRLFWAAPAEKPGDGTTRHDPTGLDLVHDEQESSLKETTVRSENRL